MDFTREVELTLNEVKKWRILSGLIRKKMPPSLRDKICPLRFTKMTYSDGLSFLRLSFS